MTHLIVALDNHEPYSLACNLIEIGVSWFKIGPQAMCHFEWRNFTEGASSWSAHVSIFLDLKLADTRDTVREAVKRFADAGIAAISTFTESATIAAIEAAEGTEIRIWQLLMLSDDARLPISGLAPRNIAAHGVICPPRSVSIFKGCGIDVVCPGIRMTGENHGGHTGTCTPSFVLATGATHAVIGRPIWNASNPIAAAKAYLKELQA